MTQPVNTDDRNHPSETTDDGTHRPTGGVSRRGLLVGASAAAGGGLLLAACGGSSGDPSTVASTTSADAASNTTSSAAATTAATSAAPTTTAAPAKTAAAGTVLAALSAIPVGGAVSAKGKDNAKILVCQPSAGKVVAFSAICTHEGCTVAPAKRSLDCPCHGSKYDIATGKVLAGPAPKPLPSVKVAIDGKNVVQS
jgi:cytochrome b6-f complex iron-sulfur subunit